MTQIYPTEVIIMSENATQKKERDIWNAQSLKSFVKVKTDWFNGDNYDSRLHLSFVEHTGKPKYEPVKTIEIGVPMVKAGSDGDKRTGITALGLCQMICNGALAGMCARERKNFEQRKAAAAQGTKVYQQAIWACIGGTPANRAKDGKAEFRKFEILPGQKEGTYAFRAMSCEGETSEALGGVQPKRGAQWTQIIVPVDGEYLYALAVNTIAEWNAQQNFRMMARAQMSRSSAQPEAPQTNAAAPAPAPAPAQTAPAAAAANAPAPAPAPHKPVRPKCVWAFYDQKFIGPMGCAVDVDRAVLCAQRCLLRLTNFTEKKFQKKLHWSKEAENALYNEIRKSSLIAAKDKQNSKLDDEEKQNMWLTPLPLFYDENPTTNKQADDILFVMVFHSVF